MPKKFKLNRPKVKFDGPINIRAECFGIVSLRRDRISKKRYSYVIVDTKGTPDEPAWFKVRHRRINYLVDEDRNVYVAQYRYSDGARVVSSARWHASPEDETQIHLAIEKYCENL